MQDEKRRHVDASHSTLPLMFVKEFDDLQHYHYAMNYRIEKQENEILHLNESHFALNDFAQSRAYIYQEEEKVAYA